VNPSITWESQSPSIATVSSSGTVKALVVGRAVIQASVAGYSGDMTQSVVAPTGVLDCGPTVFCPGDSLQRKVDAAGAGASFTFTPGVYRLQSIVTKPGQSFTGQPGAIMNGAALLTNWQSTGATWTTPYKTTHKAPAGVCSTAYPLCGEREDLFIDNVIQKRVAGLPAPGEWSYDYQTVTIGTNPSGHTVEMSVVTQAIRASQSPGVSVTGLTIEKYANAASTACLSSYQGDNTTFRGNEVRYCHGVGINIGESHFGKIIDNRVHHNGEMGLMGPFSIGLLVENNEISYNLTAGFSAGWEGGGAKFAVTDSIVIRGNFSHHNYGLGLWTDEHTRHTLYENNRVEDNDWTGIFHEISYSAVIRNNVARRNGLKDPNRGGYLGAYGIAVSTSPDVEIYGNIVEDNWNGIGAWDRSDPSPPYGPTGVRNLSVHDNTIRMITGWSGLSTQFPTDLGIYTSRGNSFYHNTYQLGGDVHYFRWQNGSRTELEWRNFGQDVDGIFNR